MCGTAIEKQDSKAEHPFWALPGFPWGSYCPARWTRFPSAKWQQQCFLFPQWGWWVNSFNLLDFSLLAFPIILPLPQVKHNPLLINEKHQVLFLHSYNCISARSTCKPPSEFVSLLTTLTSFKVVFSCVTLGQGAQSCLTQVNSPEQDFKTGLSPF